MASRGRLDLSCPVLLRYVRTETPHTRSSADCQSSTMASRSEAPTTPLPGDEDMIWLRVEAAPAASCTWRSGISANASSSWASTHC